MRWKDSLLRKRAVGSAAAILFVCSIMPACTGQTVSAEKAFALSASALSGRDRYAFAGEVSIIDPSGAVADNSRYEGEVTGHGNLDLQWTGGQLLRARGATVRPTSFHPMQLLKAIQSGNASAAYDGPPAADGTVRLRLTVGPETARRQIAEGLRAQMAELKADADARGLRPEQRKRADQVLSRANRHLEAALYTLQVRTVVLWTADRKTWFPRRMTERTELAYTWDGNPYREERVSATDFLSAGRNGTMQKNAYLNP
ncbi:hypothetical protein GE107_01295 [Cohnella sp. CFH 77786]|uniref:hypothetical protein n=1 Tax=Cohnella sp. CFH 77786 TaxID=2662265 RepID=UPI001C60846C|nr:hypothetical protein [Cohnella sp. CFH 77786]MBW5444702.1 hypothetical protein [Cohnella sp. CFH 77786]